MSHMDRIRPFHTIAILLGAFFLMSCDSEKLHPKPQAMGEPSRITVVTDQSIWKGAVGDTLRALFERPYLITPQVEPLFDLRYFMPISVQGDVYKRSLRTYIIPVNTSDTTTQTARLISRLIDKNILSRAIRDTSITNRIYKNVWAGGQVIVVIFGKNQQQLAQRIKGQYASIVNLVKQHDSKLIDKRAFVEGEHPKLMRLIDSLFGLKMRIPKGYYIAVKKKNILWIRKEYMEINMNIMISRYRYKDATQVSKEGMIKMFNEQGKLVTTDTPGDRVIIDDQHFPVILYTKRMDGYYVVEMRGIWNTLKDFFGGPMVGLAIIDPKKGTVYFLSGFVYAPSKKKRDLIQQLYHILSTVKL